jgi:hypothetical protein
MIRCTVVTNRMCHPACPHRIAAGDLLPASQACGAGTLCHTNTLGFELSFQPPLLAALPTSRLIGWSFCFGYPILIHVIFIWFDESEYGHGACPDFSGSNQDHFHAHSLLGITLSSIRCSLRQSSSRPL